MSESKSDALPLGYPSMELTVGVEPTTFCLQDRCAAYCATPAWWSSRESNSGLAECALALIRTRHHFYPVPVIEDEVSTTAAAPHSLHQTSAVNAAIRLQQNLPFIINYFSSVVKSRRSHSTMSIIEIVCGA